MQALFPYGLYKRMAGQVESMSNVQAINHYKNTVIKKASHSTSNFSLPITNFTIFTTKFTKFTTLVIVKGRNVQ